MSQQPHSYRIPIGVAAKLETVRERTWQVRLSTALLVGAAVLAAAMGLAMAIDRLAVLYDPAWRTLLTISALAAALVSLIACVRAAQSHVSRLERVAADIERSIPSLEERWTTVAQLSSCGQDRHIHPAMFRQVAQEAGTYTPDVRPETVVSTTQRSRAALALAGVTGVLLLAAILDWQRVPTLLGRFWLPMANISSTKIQTINDTPVVARGESLEIAAELGGVPVKQAKLMLEPQDGKEQVITLVPRGDHENELQHRIRSVKAPLRYRLRAGDGQTEWHEVIVAERPELAEATLTIVPPEYTQQDPEQLAKIPRRFSALVGSELQFAFRPVNAVTQLSLKMGSKSSQVLTADADGWYRWVTTLEESLTLTALLTEEHGLTNRRPPEFEIVARPDKPPVVRILTPNEEMAVRPDETVPVTFVATDDVRIGSAELVVYDENSRNQEEPRVLDVISIPLGEQEGARKVQATVDLDLSKYKVVDGAELSFAIRVREDRSLARNELPMENTPAQPPVEATQVAASQPTASLGNARFAPEERDSDKPEVESLASLATSDTTPPSQTAAESNSGQDAPMSAGSQPPPQARSHRTSAAEVAAEPADTDSQNVADAAPPSEEIPTESAQHPEMLSPLAQALADALPQGLRDLAGEAGSLNSSGQQAAPDSEAAAPSPDTALAAESQRQSPEEKMKTAVADTQETTTDRQKLTSAEQQQQPAPAGLDSQMAEDASKSGTPLGSENTTPPNEVPQEFADQDVDQQTPANGSNTENAADAAPQATAAQQSLANNSPANPSNPAQQPVQNLQGTSNSQSTNGAQQSSPSGASPPQARDLAQLDLGQGSQSATSKRMRLRVDEWAGSLAGQQRIAVEMAIAPKLMEIDQILEKAETTSRSVLDEIDGGAPWAGKHTRDVDRSGQQIAGALELVDELELLTHDTPYAFVGLQLVNIGKAQLQPARRDFWKALQTRSDSRTTATRDGWQHTVRAREMLADLTTRFEATRHEYALADSVEQIKKMYQVFLENSMAMLNMDSGAGSPYSRKRVEFNLDDEYLARLKEVLEMRNKMRAELARILADDPRLLRRFLDAQQNRQRVIRYELEELIESQRDLNREVQAWSEVQEENRAELSVLLLQRHTENVQELAVDAATLQDRFETWLPLEQKTTNRDVQAAAQLLQQVATATQELGADAETLIEQNQRAKVRDKEEQDATGAEDASTPNPVTVEKIAADAQAMQDELVSLEVSLRQLGLQRDRPEMAVFSANRLLETRTLITKTAEWLRQLKFHQDGQYHNAAEVAQYRLALETDSLAGKLADLEQQMVALLQRTDNKIPESIASKARDLLGALDEQASPNQLSAMYALRRNQLPRAVSRQKAAADALDLAAKNYDEMIKAAIKELDKLPVQDPIASLLNDPTLDELLAGLEQEFPIEELLGIPRRPTNLQIVGDFSRPGGDNALMTAGGRQMLLNQLIQRQRLRQRRLDRAYRRAVARALKEQDELKLADENELKLAQETVAWNVLLSQLGEDLTQDADKAPPERYRRAIEQYFRQISNTER